MWDPASVDSAELKQEKWDGGLILAGNGSSADRKSCGCDIVSFMSPNPECWKGVASAQVCSGRHTHLGHSLISFISWVYRDTTLSFSLILPSLHLLSPAYVHPLTPELQPFRATLFQWDFHFSSVIFSCLLLIPRKYSAVSLRFSYVETPAIPTKWWQTLIYVCSSFHPPIHKFPVFYCPSRSRTPSPIPAADSVQMRSLLQHKYTFMCWLLIHAAPSVTQQRCNCRCDGGAVI